MSDTIIQPDVQPSTPGEDLTGNTTSNQQQESLPQSLYRRLLESAHPIALLFYLILRLSPLTIYLFGLWFTSNYILFFIVVILLLAADFWNVKNIAGRLLVGLRWWNETNDVGKSVLVFETADPSRHINPIDSKVFWFLMYICPIVWILFGIMALLKLQFLSLILVGIGIVLTASNTMAYTKCDKFGKANSFATDVFGSVTGNVFDKMNPFKGFFNRQ